MALHEVRHRLRSPFDLHITCNSKHRSCGYGTLSLPVRAFLVVGLLLALEACGGRAMQPPATPYASRAPDASSAGADWTQFAYDEQRDAYNAAETTLSPSTVPGLTQKWAAHVDSAIYAQPLLLHALSVGGTTRSVLYVTSFYHLSAIDANASSGTSTNVLWSRALPSTYTSCAGATVHNGAWATPYLDKARGRLYLVDGARNLDAFNIVTGSQVYSTPVVSFDNGGVDGALSLDAATAHLYVTTAMRCGYENTSSPIRGSVVSYDPASGARLSTFTTVTATGYYGGSLWGMGGVSIDPATHGVYGASGNSWPTNTTYGEHINYAESIIALSSASHLLASNYPGVGQPDHDFGATPTLFQPAGCAPMAALSNKDGELLIYDRAKISAGPIARIAMANPYPGDFINAPAFDPLTQMLYETSSTDSPVSATYNHGLSAFAFSGCKPHLVFNVAEGTVAPTGAHAPDDPYSSPTVANGVVYFGAGTTNVVYANDARTGRLLWHSPALSADAEISPMVVNGRLYVVAGGSVYAYGL